MWHQAFFFFKWVDFPINSHCCCLLSAVHVLCFGVVNEAQIYLFLYFQIPLNCSSEGADCICCTFSLHTVPLFVWFDFASVSIIIAHKTIQFLIFFQMEDRVKESNYMLQEKSENVHTCNSTTTSMTASTTTGICQWWIISTPTDRGHLSYIQRWKWKTSRQLLRSSTVQKLRVISRKGRSWSAYQNTEKWLKSTGWR